jgi:hypothetical protein
VPPGDPRALADGIVRLLRAPDMAARLGAAAHAHALAEFGMPRMLERVEAFYRHGLGLDASSPLSVAPVS